MAAIAVTKAGSGSDPGAGDTTLANGDTVANDGATIVRIKNAHATLSRTVTFLKQANCSQGFAHDLAVTVPALSERIVSLHDTGRFNDSSGNVVLNFDTTADLTIWAWSPRP